MYTEYEADPTVAVQAAVTAADTQLVVPRDQPLNPGMNPKNIGSMYFITVLGNPVAWNRGAVAVFAGANMSIIPVTTGSPWGPVELSPGAAYHFICGAALTATVTICRARRST